MNKNSVELHPELKDNPGFAHLFTVGEGHPEQENVGKKCRYINPTCPHERQIFTIGSLQFDYAGRLCYRVYAEGDTFGNCAQLNKVEIIEG